MPHYLGLSGHRGLVCPKVYKTNTTPVHYVHQEIMEDKIYLELVFKFNGHMNCSGGYLVQIHNYYILNQYSPLVISSPTIVSNRYDGPVAR